MEKLSTKVNDIYLKVEKLILLQKRLGEENVRLQEENKILKGQLEGKKQEIQELEYKNKVIKIARSLSDIPGEKEGSRDIKLKVNEIIREVDRCIAMLNS